MTCSRKPPDGEPRDHQTFQNGSHNGLRKQGTRSSAAYTALANNAGLPAGRAETDDALWQRHIRMLAAEVSEGSCPSGLGFRIHSGEEAWA